MPVRLGKDLMNAANDSATTVVEQKPQGCNSSPEARLRRRRRIRHITHAKKKVRAVAQHTKVSVATNGEQTVYWVKGIFHEQLDGHYIFQHLCDRAGDDGQEA